MLYVVNKLVAIKRWHSSLPWHVAQSMPVGRHTLALGRAADYDGVVCGAGLSWLISSKVAMMGRSVWRQHYAELQAWLLTSSSCAPSSLPSHLAEWLQYQQCMHMLGLLENWKQHALQSALE